ncbi:Hypothetical predicted protein [Marmota monax]|uniref:Uncharacterized protein n=1 Tax=Marmota monax TaxID=9995 RepID=A0A5E4A6H0_MARMO|nr:hypothetical protein GHT09_015807 [Marmota monax]VTJ52291.1 Hypothetical predicted protein [Marmota monax]
MQSKTKGEEIFLRGCGTRYGKCIQKVPDLTPPTRTSRGALSLDIGSTRKCSSATCNGESIWTGAKRWYSQVSYPSENPVLQAPEELTDLSSWLE